MIRDDRISYSHNVIHYVITIKKISGLVILTAFLLSPAFAEAMDGNYGFSISSGIGVLYGHSEEIVYHFPKDDLYLSELLWDLKPLPYAGFSADFSPLDTSMKKGFIAALSFKAGIPVRSGISENRDWFNPDPYYLTHYSKHNAYSRTVILLDVSAGYFWRFTDSLALSVHGDFSYLHFSWSAKDGYAQYAVDYPWNSSIPKEYYKGEVMRYMQNWFILSPGVSLDWEMNRLFSFKTHINYSPLIYCADRDDHLLMNASFMDYLYFGHYLESGGEFIFRASRNTSLSLSLSYRRISGTRGDTFQQSWRLDYDTGNTVLQTRRYNDEAGAAFSALDLGFAVKFRLTGRG